MMSATDDAVGVGSVVLSGAAFLLQVTLSIMSLFYVVTITDWAESQNIGMTTRKMVERVNMLVKLEVLLQVAVSVCYFMRLSYFPFAVNVALLLYNLYLLKQGQVLLDYLQLWQFHRMWLGKFKTRLACYGVLVLIAMSRFVPDLVHYIVGSKGQLLAGVNSMMHMGHILHSLSHISFTI